MRILVLTNGYPPLSTGGMELSCEETVMGLRERGHQVQVLTCRGDDEGNRKTSSVSRQLYLEVDPMHYRNAWRFFTQRHQRESENRAILRRHIEGYCPDLVFVWGMWNLHRSLAADAEKLMGMRVLYRFGDYWPTLPTAFDFYWRARGRNTATNLAKALARPMALYVLRRDGQVRIEFPHSYCISHAARRHLLASDVSVANSEVIHSGFDLSAFGPPERRTPSSIYRLLYVGRLAPEKGVDVAIDALKELKQGSNVSAKHWRLTMVGDGSIDYERLLKAKVAALGLTVDVRFVGRATQDELPAIYREHGVLLIPSQWKEPFGRVALEGMASSLLVVASSNGALPEIIDHRATGILVPSGDPHNLASWLDRAADDWEMVTRIATRGRQRALSEFTFEKMMVKIERLLHKAASTEDGCVMADRVSVPTARGIEA